MMQLFKMLLGRGAMVDGGLPERLAAELALPDWRQRMEGLGRIDRRVGRALSRSLLVRHLDVGSSNGEEAELVSLSTAPSFDLPRFGIDFTASPRHADVLAVTGPVTRQLKVAMDRTYAATPAPKLVLAIGDAACGLGVFERNYACLGPVKDFLPVDLEVPGNPPDPEEILKGFLLCKMILGADGR
ncbi:MAG TPA: hypothetical protein V6D23_27885 [Candidatus Obscuribacterales bacterium]